MPAHITLMPNALIDQMFSSPTGNPEEALIRGENVPEESRAQVRDWQVAHEQSASERQRQEELARQRERLGLFVEEVSALSFLQKGDLAAWLTDIKGLNRRTAAWGLCLSSSATGVAKWKALADRPCGSTKGQCEGVAGCAHERGAALCKDLVRRVLRKLPVEEGGPC